MISDVSIKVKRGPCYACGVFVERCIMDNLRLSLAPCRQACPLDINCQGYVRLIAQGREKEAAEELRLHTPFGAILGRVCSHPCEAVCERLDIDGPVHIRALKRYLADAYPDRSRAKGGKRGKLRRLAVQDRTLQLEVEKTLSGDEVHGEAERCLSCGRAAEANRTCWYCLPCEIECPVNALEVRIPYLVR